MVWKDGEVRGEQKRREEGSKAAALSIAARDDLLSSQRCRSPESRRSALIFAARKQKRAASLPSGEQARAPRRGCRGESKPGGGRLELDQDKRARARESRPPSSAAASQRPWLRNLSTRGHARETTGSSACSSWRREGEARAQKRPKLGLMGGARRRRVVGRRAIDDDVMMVSLGPIAWLCTASLINSLPRTMSHWLPRSNAGGFGEK